MVPAGLFLPLFYTKESLVSFNTISCNQEHNIIFSQSVWNKQYFIYIVIIREQQKHFMILHVMDLTYLQKYHESTKKTKFEIRANKTEYIYPFIYLKLG